MNALAEPVTPQDRTIGVEPVPDSLRRLRAVDVAVLWGNLSIGILVLAAGALLALPADSGGLGLALGPAVAAVLVGSAAGAFLLAAVAWVGHEPGRPTMALLRSVLGDRGSHAASVVNIVQLVGWTAFELWAMAQFADHIADTLFGVSSRILWVAAVAAACAALALAGPLAVVRVALERVGTWVLALACIALTITVVVDGTGAGAAGGGVPFAVAVDLVVAMPVSWLSVVADYNRFSADRRANFAGTFAGSFVGNSWIYLLGVLLVLSGRLTDSSPAGIAAGVIGGGAGTLVGVVVIAGLLAGELPNAFADIYSTVVSAQNLTRRLPYRAAVLTVVVVSALIASLATVANFETFLFLLGSVFIPLFAVVLANGVVDLLKGEGARRQNHHRWAMGTAWALGFAAYQWIVPTGPDGWVSWIQDHVAGAGQVTAVGASLPSFALAFMAGLSARLLDRPPDAGRAGPSSP